MEHKFNFPKREHLYGKNSIDNLYNKGKAFVSFPFKIVYVCVPKTEIPVRCMMVAPKKRFKHAVDRNRVKRLMRETYRKNKLEICEFVSQKDFQLNVSFLYIDNSILTYEVFNKKMISALSKLKDKIKDIEINY